MNAHKKRPASRDAGHHPKHSLGQNFIHDPGLLKELAALSAVTSGDCVLEIGPGMGTLTRALAERARRVLCVEIDQTLEPFLALVLQAHPNAEVVFSDVMQTNLAKLCLERFGSNASIRVAANLPYYITTDVLQKLMRELTQARSIAVMVQAEVAQKLIAAPGDEGYGPLCLECQWRYAVRIARFVPAECFDPKPKVDSAFVVLERRSTPPCMVSDEGLLLRLFRSAFAMRRKTLANNLRAFPGMDKDRVEACLLRAGLLPTARAEQMDIDAFCRLADAMASIQKGQDDA